MTDPGITLNIYNKPPEFEENTNNDINQAEEGVNTTLDLPTQSVVNNIRANASSAPEANKGFQTVENTRNNTLESSDNYESNVQPIPIQQYPQPIIGYPPPQMGAIPVTPIQTPMVQPYNAQYAQPVIVQQRVNNPPPPKTVIIRKKKEKNQSAGDCCTGFLAGCGAFLAACCLISLCSGGGGRRYGRRGRW